jgi:hypothetical protein
MLQYFVFDSDNLPVDTYSFWTDSSARRWFFLMKYHQKPYTLKRMHNDNLIEVKTR